MKDSICTWRELQNYISKLAERHTEDKGEPPTMVYLPTVLREKFYDRFHGEDMFLYKDAQGKRCMLRIAAPISVS